MKAAETAEIPAEDCPPDHTGVYYNLDIEMELETEKGPEVRPQQWQISIFQSKTQVALDNQKLFLMIQDFFNTNL